MTTTAVGRVAFLGLGRMGIPMATNLARGGIDLTVYNRTRSTAEMLATELGCRYGATAADAVKGQQIVITMLADIAAADAIYLGSDGILDGLDQDTLVVDMSTLGPAKVAQLARAVDVAGGTFIDAPVSGSVDAATQANLTILAGGTTQAIAQAAPVLELLGQGVHHLGPVGSGATMKLAVNAIVFSLNQSISEALVFAERAGIDRRSAYAVFADSAIAAPFVHYRRREFEEPGTTPNTFLLRLALKDLDLALVEASQVGASMPQTELNRDVLRRAIEAGYGDANMTAVADLLRQRPAVDIGDGQQEPHTESGSQSR